MPSTYTNLGIELMADGENANTWGQKTNVNLEMIEEALAGIAVISITGSTSIPSFSNGTSGSNARKGFLRFEGSLSGTATITLPTKDKIYGVANETTGGQSITLTCGSGSNVTIPNGKSTMIHTSSSTQNVTNLSNQDVSTDSSVTNAIAKIPSSWTSSAQSILGLTDTPSSFSGQQGKVLKVNSGQTGLEFADDDAGSGSGGDAATLNGQSGSYYLNYSNFSNTPTIPTNNNQLTNGAGYITSATPSADSVRSSYISGIWTGSEFKVGAYVFLSPMDTSQYAPGSTNAASNWQYAGATDIDSSGNSIQNLKSGTVSYGTWRSMGNRRPGGSYSSGWHIHAVVLFLRVA